jgi:hypothetical protein
MARFKVLRGKISEMDLWTAVAATAGCDTLALRGDPVAAVSCPILGLHAE